MPRPCGGPTAPGGPPVSLPPLPVYHLVYRSQATAPLDAPQLRQLLEQARAFNQRHDLTGLLLYSPDHQFLQVLEGEADAVRSLYYRHIAQDPRHRDCFVLAEGPWLHRSFADWRMGLLTPEYLDSSTPPGFAAISQLEQVLPLLAGAHPGLNRLLADFVARYDPVG